MSTLPVTMTVDDELARLRSMLADLRTLNADFARICDERDQYHIALCVAADTLATIAREGIDMNTFNEGGIGYDAVMIAAPLVGRHPATLQNRL